MATTGYWPVKSRLKEVIDYAENPDKTIDTPPCSMFPMIERPMSVCMSAVSTATLKEPMSV